MKWASEGAFSSFIAIVGWHLSQSATAFVCVSSGEVGLAGEIRPVPNGQERIKEARKHGFEVAIVPKANAPKKGIEGIEIKAVSKISEALTALSEI